MCHARAAVYALALALLGLAGRPAAAQVFARADDTRAAPPEYRPRRPLRVELSGGATFLAGNVDTSPSRVRVRDKTNRSTVAVESRGRQGATTKVYLG